MLLKKDLGIIPKCNTKKKVGILTYHYSNNNFGAVLQAFSIYKLIENLGYESYIINYKAPIYSLKGKIFFFLQKMLGFEFEKFRKKYIKRKINIYGRSIYLKSLNKFFDAFVVGSDQVWRYKHDIKVLYTYFLDFVDNYKIKVAYGASFGLDVWEGDKQITEQVQNLMKKFNAISVREESGVNICKNIFDIECDLVIDPTLTIDKKYFYEIANKIDSIPVTERYLAFMLLEDSKDSLSFFKDLAENRRLKFLDIKGFSVFTKKGFYVFNSIEKWLKLIQNAEIIVTDSFHCTVFSIIFHKKFICLANTNRGVTRLHNLLNLISQKSRFYTLLNEFNEIDAFSEIDYQRIDSILEIEKQKSIYFLKRALSN